MSDSKIASKGNDLKISVYCRANPTTVAKKVQAGTGSITKTAPVHQISAVVLNRQSSRLSTGQ